MSITKILKEDWSDYESRKIAKHKNLIDCRVPWETNYLINKIKQVYPNLSDSIIIDAFTACCLSMGSPCERKKFIEYISNKLEIAQGSYESIKLYSSAAKRKKPRQITDSDDINF